MIYKKLSLSVLLFAAGFLTASAQKSPQDMDRFIDVLMNKMTLEEKIGQFESCVRDLKRFNIPSHELTGRINRIYKEEEPYA